MKMSLVISSRIFKVLGVLLSSSCSLWVSHTPLGIYLSFLPSHMPMSEGGAKSRTAYLRREPMAENLELMRRKSGFAGRASIWKYGLELPTALAI